MNKKVKLAIAVVVVGGIGTTAAMSIARRSHKAVDVRIEPVEARDLIASVTASGQIRPRTKVDIASDVTGKIVKLSVNEGDYVTEGQFLLEIDPQNAVAAVQRAEAALSSARAGEVQTNANLLQAQRSYDRNVQIRNVSKTLVTDEQMEQLKTALEVATAVHESSKHSVEQAEASVTDARTSLGKTKLYAPMAGRVTRLNVSQGETAIMGTLNKDAATLLTISDMSVLETRVRVDETDVAHIVVGDSASIQIDAFPDTTFVGRVTKISNSSVRGASTTGADQAVDYEVTIQLLNQRAETRPDFSATARIVTAQRKHVLAIPIVALTVRENLPVGGGDTAVGLGRKASSNKSAVGKKDVEGVFVVDTANKVTFRPVRVGIAGDEHFEVLGGLNAGDRIVAGTYQAIRDLKDGTLVRDLRSATDSSGKTQSGTQTQVKRS